MRSLLPLLIGECACACLCVYVGAHLVYADTLEYDCGYVGSTVRMSLCMCLRGCTSVIYNVNT